MLEQRIAALKGYPEALVFGSGFLANIGVIAALAGRGDHVFADKLAHASIIDGIVLAGPTSSVSTTTIRTTSKSFLNNAPQAAANW